MWIYKLERKIPWFRIPNLMFFIVIISGMVYLFDFISAMQRNNVSLYSMIYFDRNLILQGQFWRLLSFIFVPPSGSPFFVLLGLYFLYFIGRSLEAVWGEFKLTLYYFIGIIFCILGGFLVGSTNVIFLNLSLFFAFAATHPELQILLFFVIPVKVKWLAYLDAVIFLFSIISSLLAMNWSNAVAAVMAIINFLIFFGPKFFSDMFTKLKYWKNRRDFMNKTNNSWRN